VGAVALAVGASGTSVLLSLIYLVLSFYAVVTLFIVVVPGAICAIFRINLFRFLASPSSAQSRPPLDAALKGECSREGSGSYVIIHP
jgi:Na+/H+-dicarboxylate symporter